ncbi:MAG: hypothetical protein ABI675_22120 [Chitinophagaceae bacterium]
MKKFLIGIVALLYITTSSGAVVHLHYCMGKLAGWDFGENKSKTCGGCGMEKAGEKDNGCCKDEHKFLKNDSDQKTTNSVFALTPIIAVAHPSTFFELPATYFTPIATERPFDYDPSRSGIGCLHIRNCVFRI